MTLRLRQGGSAAAVRKKLFLWCEVLVHSRGKSLKQFVSRVGGVSHNLSCTDHLLSRVNDTLQPAPVLNSGSSVPDGDGGGEDGLNDGGVEVHHHCLWQVELLQLPQEVHPLLGFFGEGADVQLVDDGPRKWKESTVSIGESHRVMGAGGAAFLL